MKKDQFIARLNPIFKKIVADYARARGRTNQRLATEALEDYMIRADRIDAQTDIAILAAQG
jgi:hypothetical protein